MKFPEKVRVFGSKHSVKREEIRKLKEEHEKLLRQVKLAESEKRDLQQKQKCEIQKQNDLRKSRDHALKCRQSAVVRFREAQRNRSLPVVTIDVEMDQPAIFIVNPRMPRDQTTVSYPILRRQETVAVPKMEELGDLTCYFKQDGNSSLIPAFMDESLKRGDVIVVPREQVWRNGHKIFLVGDIHGDFKACRKVLEYAWGVDSGAVVVFLGDLIDRGEQSLEVVRLMAWAMANRPGQVLWLAGNHDLALQYDTVEGRFTSSVEPAEFADWLNAHPDYREEGDLLLSWIPILPKALVLGDIWIVHGGVPQSDLIAKFTGLSTMSKEMTNDFVWNRMVDAPNKLFQRGRHGVDAALQQATEFFKKLQEIEGLTLKHVVCAHQHAISEGVGYLPFVKKFSGDISCVSLFSSFACNGKDCQPCILELSPNGDMSPVALSRQ